MPGLEIKSDMISGKSIPYLENGDGDVSLTKSEVCTSPIRNFMMRPTVGDKNDVKMEETKGEENGSD